METNNKARVWAHYPGAHVVSLETLRGYAHKGEYVLPFENPPEFTVFAAPGFPYEDDIIGTGRTERAAWRSAYRWLKRNNVPTLLELRLMAEASRCA